MLAKANWQEILHSGYRNPHALLKDLGLPPGDVSADSLFATWVPRPFAEKMQPGDPNDPLLLQVLPDVKEFEQPSGFSADPLAEQHFNPVPGLLHKYNSRVLLTLRGACAINCRYCFRRHFDYADNRVNADRLQAIIDYINAHPQVNEVIFSGGDPLMAKDQQLQHAVDRLGELPQLKRLRFHSRLPVVIPERINAAFIAMTTTTRLKTVMVIHCNHPNEIDDNFAKHIKLLSDAGVQLFNQGVLLKKVNDDAGVLADLSEKLFACEILPYYLFLLDKVSGAAHFEVPEDRARELIRQVAARLPGYLVPKLARETAGMASKNMWV